ncbi:MAG: tetratricopeptide repeat protein [bacterium]
MQKSKIPNSAIVFILVLVAVLGVVLVKGFNYVKNNYSNIHLAGNKDQVTASSTSEAMELNDKGMDYYDSRDYPNAEIFFRKAIATDPALANPYNNLGIVLALRGVPEEALANYRKAIEIAPTYANAYSNIGAYYREKNDFPNAIKNFTQAITLDANLYIPYIQLGDIYTTQGDYVKAKSFYQKALESTQITPQMVDEVKKQLSFIKSLK